MKRLRTLLGVFALTLLPLVALADATQKCDVCSMTIDDAHNVHFRYLAKRGETHLGSLTCSKKHWEAHKAEEMTFEAKDFVTGRFTDAKKGVFLVGSKLKVGTGMDKTSVVFFSDEKQAQKAKEANGGRLVDLMGALDAAAR